MLTFLSRVKGSVVILSVRVHRGLQGNLTLKLQSAEIHIQACTVIHTCECRYVFVLSLCHCYYVKPLIVNYCSVTNCFYLFIYFPVS